MITTPRNESVGELYIDRAFLVGRCRFDLPRRMLSVGAQQLLDRLFKEYARGEDNVVGGALVAHIDQLSVNGMARLLEPSIEDMLRFESEGRTHYRPMIAPDVPVEITQRINEFFIKLRIDEEAQRAHSKRAAPTREELLFRLHPLQVGKRYMHDGKRTGFMKKTCHYLGAELEVVKHLKNGLYQVKILKGPFSHTGWHGPDDIYTLPKSQLLPHPDETYDYSTEPK